MTATGFLQFPRGVAALQLHITGNCVSASLFGPPSGGLRPQLFHAAAPTVDCWRTTTRLRGDALPQKLFIGEACVALTREEALQVDELLREHLPASAWMRDGVAA